ncbi:MAG: branched-chain amino acid ABC transporter permease [Thermodesulfobacteriota bacterium]
MSEILQFIFAGVMIGSVYGLIAVAFCMVYNATEVINFAQGEFVMLGGMIAAVIFGHWGWPLPLVILAAVVLCCLIGLILEKLSFGLSRNPQVLNMIIVTIGLAIAIKGAAMMIWGKFPKDMPAFSGETPIACAGATLVPQCIWIVGLSVATMLLMRLFLEKTIMGTAMRAAAAEKTAAALVGIPVRLVSTISFGIASAIGALAGIILTPVSLTSFDHGTMLGLKGFCSAIIGGMGNVYGGFLGGLVLGLLETFGAGLISSGYRDVIAFSSLIILLLVRPSGLLGETGRERIVKV